MTLIFVQSVDDIYVFNPTFPNYENQTDLLHGRFSYLIKLKKIHIYIWNRLAKKMESIDRGNHEDNYFGGFVNYITSFGDLNFNPSFRLDYNQHYGLQFCPQFDINYSNEAINVRASAGEQLDQLILQKDFIIIIIMELFLQAKMLEIKIKCRKNFKL